MGNQQSNERQRNRNWKIYKITEKIVGDDYIRCYLDDYVPYSNGNHKNIAFVKIPAFLSLTTSLIGTNDRPSLCEGNYIAIDIDMTRNHDNGYEFDSRDVKEVNSSSFPGEGGLQGLIEDIEAMRELRARANEWSDFDKEMQRAWQLQPPKK